MYTAKFKDTAAATTARTEPPNHGFIRLLCTNGQNKLYNYCTLPKEVRYLLKILLNVKDQLEKWRLYKKIKFLKFSSPKVRAISTCGRFLKPFKLKFG